MKRLLSTFLLIILCLSGCGEREDSVPQPAPGTSLPGDADRGLIEERSDTQAESGPTRPPGKEPDKGRAEGIARSLDDFSLAAQVIMGGIDGNLHISEPMRPLLERIPLGVYLLFSYNLGGEPEAVRAFLAECTALTVAAGDGGAAVPLAPFVAVDHEGGQVHRFGPGVGRLPSALSYEELAGKAGQEAALRAVEEDALRAGREIRALGVNLNLAPVAEPLTEENRVFLEDRSYGADPDFAAAAAGAFIRGMEEAGVACTAKHFPGNSGVDPHQDRTVLGAGPEGPESLDRLTWPFAELIRSRPPSFIMVSHALVPNRDQERPASLSPAIMGDWLRGELGFQGIILADDFSMAAGETNLSPGEAAVAALNAGADMVIVWPINLNRVHQAILAALAEGRLKRERLLDAAARIIGEKLRFGLAIGLAAGPPEGGLVGGD